MCVVLLSNFCFTPITFYILYIIYLFMNFRFICEGANEASKKGVAGKAIAGLAR
jgi:hypothetical protein